jgi:hypothetical protein
MKFFEILLWLMLIFVAYVQLTVILFKGKQYNRLFATFINLIVPIVGSVPTFIIACNYEEKITGLTDKLSGKTLRYLQIGLQLLSVILLFLPFFSSESASSSGINMIFGKAVEGSVVRPTMLLIYLVVFPVVSSIINFAYDKNNINNFISYSVSLLNILSIILLNFVLTTGNVESTIWAWLYCYVNVAIMYLSTTLLIVHRNSVLEYMDKEEKSESESESETADEAKTKNNTYICSKCGKDVIKGTICSCIERRLSASRETSLNTDSENRPHGFCIYCKRALSEGEKCNCLGDGFGITIKNELPKSRKCMYCGQELIGESTCVCEKIMKNSVPVQNTDGQNEEPKHMFKEDIEKSSSKVADEISELEKMINLRIAQVKETMNLKSDSDDK